MNRKSAWNMFVFRDGRRFVAGATLARALENAIRSAAESAGQRAQAESVNALLLAGELECALSDESRVEAARLAAITDSLALATVNHDARRSSSATRSVDCGTDLTALLRLVPERLPQQMKVSPPEGFAYYALHPLDFVDLAGSVPIKSGHALVIGIRSIGATLSALVMAGLHRRGLHIERFTVRPAGHPYDRKTAFSPDQEEQIRKCALRGADFLVVDEGPGMSGSSFLSVGDALVAAGVSRDSIAFLGSRLADPDSLQAPNGADRWREYRSYCAQKNSRLPHDAKLYAGGGEWRSHLYRDRANWPASWIQMERLKFFSPDRGQLFKFEGFGRFGATVHENSARIAQGGFTPAPVDMVEGFGVYPVIAGEPLTARDLSPALVDRMAEYCAFRVREFACPDGQNSEEIESMVRFNVAEEFGQDIALEPGSLHAECPVLVDGRMLPYEWLQAEGRYLKVDCASHGDDHFFPGPTDIAWDLAGAIVEWGLDEKASKRLIHCYHDLSGDNPHERLPNYLLAYSVFRLGYCKMAAEAVGMPEEAERLMAAHRYYRSFAESRLQQLQDFAAAD